jgi:lysophospholipase L1-like esterase
MPADTASRKKTWLLALLAVMISGAFALVAGEILLRLMGFESKLVYQPNPYYGWSHTAHDQFTRVMGDREIEISINSQGLRDFEYAYERDADVFRILVLGDSFTEAFQVDLEESFLKVLERKLNAEASGGPSRYEVIGAGVSGFGTDNELLFFRHEGHKYSPDVVMVALYIGNDIRNNWYELDVKDSGGLRKPYFVLADGELSIREYPFEQHVSLKTRLKVFLNRNVSMYSLLRELRDRLRHQRRPGGGRRGVPLDARLFAEDYPEPWENAWAVSQGLILKLRDEVREAGAELFVVMIPTRFQVHEQYWAERIENSDAMGDIEWNLDKPNAILSRFLTENDVPHVDLLRPFRERSAESGKEYYIADDGHWNRDGHELSVEFIERELTGAGFVGQRRGVAKAISGDARKP